MENKINASFRHNLKDHVWQKMGREVCDCDRPECICCLLLSSEGLFNDPAANIDPPPVDDSQENG